MKNTTTQHLSSQSAILVVCLHTRVQSIKTQSSGFSIALHLFKSKGFCHIIYRKDKIKQVIFYTLNLSQKLAKAFRTAPQFTY